MAPAQMLRSDADPKTIAHDTARPRIAPVVPARPAVVASRPVYSVQLSASVPRPWRYSFPREDLGNDRPTQTAVVRYTPAAASAAGARSAAHRAMDGLPSSVLDNTRLIAAATLCHAATRPASRFRPLAVTRY